MSYQADWQLQGLEYKMREFIDREMTAGFLDPEEIVASIMVGREDDPDFYLLTHVLEQRTEEALRWHLAQQESWPEITDCDRLDRAFSELERNGILARQHHMSETVRKEATQRASEGQPVRGCTYYCHERTAKAIRGEGLYLNFQSVQGIKGSALVIAQEVVDTLQRHGLTATWDGAPYGFVRVDMNWQRRRPTAT